MHLPQIAFAEMERDSNNRNRRHELDGSCLQREIFFEILNFTDRLPSASRVSIVVGLRPSNGYGLSKCFSRITFLSLRFILQKRRGSILRARCTLPRLHFLALSLIVPERIEIPIPICRGSVLANYLHRNRGIFRSYIQHQIRLFKHI